MRSNVFFGLIAVAVMATVSCNKEIENVVPVVPTNGTHTVCFKADEVATKTSLVLNGTTYSAIWTDADEANFHIFENGVEGLAEMTKSSDSKSATFKAIFNDGATAPFNYTAILSSEYNDVNNSAPVASIQNPAANNIDGAADLLIAKPVVLNAQPAATDEIHFQFKRVVSINKMTIRGLEVGEKVTEVTISGDKKIAAVYDVAADEFDYTLGDDAIILGYTDNNVITSAGTFDVYFVCAPIENATLSIEVKTEDNSNPVKTRTYKKDFTKTISFDLTTVAEFVANVTCCEEVTGGASTTEIFNESFDGCDGTGGRDNSFSGSIASNNYVDSQMATEPGWSMNNVKAAKECIKVGTSAGGYAITKAIGITQSSATISFDAALWSNNSEKYVIVLSLEDAPSSAAISPSEFTLTKSVWNTFTATITDADKNTKVKFTQKETTTRFFLDNVIVSEERSSDPNTVSLTIADNTDINGSETEATINIASNKAWTVTSNDPLLANTPISIKGTAQDGSFTVSFNSANSSFTQDKVATLHIVAGAGSYAQEKDITVTQLKAVPVLTVDSATKTVEASATSTSFTVTECNFDWDVISVKVDGSENSDYTAVKGENGVVNVSFPSNSAIDATTDERSIVVTVGADDILTTSCTITQEGETYVDPNKIYYVKVTETPSSGDWSGIYLIVAENASKILIPEFNGTSGGKATGVTISDSRIESTPAISANAWIIEKDGNNSYTVKNGNLYLGWESGNAAQSYSVATSNNAKNIFAISSGAATIKNSADNSRILRYNSQVTDANGPFRYYAGTTGAVAVLYKLNDGKTDAGVSVNYSDAITYAPNDATVQLNVTNPNNVVLSFTSSSESVATVNNSGLVTIKGAGEATITASWEDTKVGDITYRGGSCEYSLSIAKATPVIAAFADSDVEVAVGSSITKTTTIDPSSLSIVYTTSDNTVASIDASTGAVTGLKNGTVTISATFAGNANYNAAETKTYSLKVGTGESDITAVPHQTITFSTLGYSNQQEVSSVNGTNCTLSFAKGTNSNAPKYFTTGSALRLYGGNSMTITVDAKYKITSIKLTFSSGENTNEITTNVGSYSDGTWSGSIENGGSVTFTVSGSSGHRRIASVEIN